MLKSSYVEQLKCLTLWLLKIEFILKNQFEIIPNVASGGRYAILSTDILSTDILSTDILSTDILSTDILSTDISSTDS
jgi:hypothetical protein